MIIGIVGFIGSGKGSVGDILVSHHNFKKISFADPVKDCVSVIFGWPRHLLEGDTDESRNFRETVDQEWSRKLGYVVTPRYMLQIIGTESGRNVIHSDIWVYSAQNRMKQYENVVIPDVRFKNEIKMLNSMGAHVVRVKRGEDPVWWKTALDHNLNGIYKMDIEYPEVHVSEWDWIGQKMDYTILNEGTKGDLERKTNNMLKELREYVMLNS